MRYIAPVKAKTIVGAHTRLKNSNLASTMIVNCKTAVTKLENKIEIDTNKTLLCRIISIGDSFKSRLLLFSDSGIIKYNVSANCPT